ncbi:LacI family DNA-binding transcriptional regulator [Deinococcus roseus]|uniref:LacI family transcriptional regulator n=1 Tax=Deinococcus roseus TaxID=392414 RepID=A0ABQ2CWP7_9DEIO|nr:LacI family DNA-binding transcriptional regulator [Deinococcus roseus]GGJ28273.1 LacI family transcriptional regulator [Deinococcus roseus]
MDALPEVAIKNRNEMYTGQESSLTPTMNNPDRNLFKKPTSADVARHLGISQSTVSLVLNGKAEGRVSQELQQAIWEAARMLNYKPNRAAKALREGRARTLALVVPQLSNPFFAPVYQGADQEARKLGYDTILVNYDHSMSTQEALIEHLFSHDVDGYVLWDISARSSNLLDQGNVVLVEGRVDGFHSIMVDIPHGIQMALQHLLALGHSRIAHLAATVETETFQARTRAYQQFFAEQGWTLKPEWQVKAPFSLEGGKEGALQLLSLPEERPTAILCDGDFLAVGVYKAAKQLGLRIPEDLSVIGVDNLELSQYIEPELTTLHIPAYQMGQAAAQQLIQLLEGQPRAEKVVWFQTELIKRGSAAAPGQ